MQEKNNFGENLVKTNEYNIDKVKDNKVEYIIQQAVRLPVVRVNREKFLYKELMKYYSEDTVRLAINRNPAFAGIKREKINEISKHVISYETNKVSTVSFMAGVPGGFAMFATVPADIIQYFGFMIRTMQKLAYLYGFPDFELSEDEISDETLNQFVIFLGVMFGVQGANAGVKKIAETAAQKILKTLPQKALTKGVVYPIVKKIATMLGVKMTKQIFAEGVSKVVPVIGGVITGGLTYVTFKPCAKKLGDSLKKLPLSDPEFYKKQRTKIIDM